MIKFKGVKYDSAVVYLEGDETVVLGDEFCSKVDRDLRLFVKSTNVAGLYKYGAEQLEDSYDHRKGYVWSSRASVMNKAFNLQTIECLYDNRFYALDLARLEELLEGTDYTVSWEPAEENNTDATYKVVKKNN